MQKNVTKTSELVITFINFSIRHTISISRAIELDDQTTADNLLTEKIIKLLKEDLERSYLMAIYVNRLENFKSVFLIDNMRGIE